MGMPSPVQSYLSSNANVPITPSEMLETAEALAQELQALPASQRNSELRQLKQHNELMHSAVTQALKDLRSRASSAGASMLLGEQPAAQ